MSNESQPASLPAVPDAKEEEKWTDLGFLSAAPPERSIGLRCDKCLVKWVGCQDAAECPKCGDTTAWETLAYDATLEEPGAVEANTVNGQMELLGVVKAAYLKHHCGLDNVGWEQLDSMMCDALCNAMGNTEFQRWLEENTR